jgi:crotonobetainyl-CoA:carnitine CoA-transferase CaiB-like acyl-CoA transferase
MRGLGADVTRVAPIEGGNAAAPYFLSSGKRALPVIGPVTAQEPSVAAAIAQADVVLVSGTPDQVRARGLDYVSLASRDASLVVGRVTLFGDRGEWCALAGDGYQAGALSGLQYMVGEPDRQPLRLGGTQVEFSTAVSLFTGVQMALFARAGTGRGGEVTTSAVRSTAALDWKSSIYVENEGRVLRRGSDRGPLVVECQDGYVGFYYRAEDWPAVKELFGDPELENPEFATQADRDLNRDAVSAVVARGARRFTKRDLYTQAQAKKIPAGYVMALPDLPRDAQFAARGTLSERTLADGTRVQLPQTPWTVDGTRADWFAAPAHELPDRGADLG